MKAFLPAAALHLLGGTGAPELVPPSAQEAQTQELIPGVEYAPMSSLMWCLSSLAAVYFLVCSLLLVARLLRQLRGSSEPLSFLLQTLVSAELTVEFAPMLCVLFLAAQLQAMSVSGGREDPPRWMLRCMEVATIGLVLQTTLTFLLPALLGEGVDVDEDTGRVGDASVLAEASSNWRSGETSQMVRGAFLGLGQMLSYIAFFALYGAIGAVCVGVMLKASPLDPVPAASPAVVCTVNLTIQFFVVRLLFAGAAFCAHGGRGACKSKLYEVLKLAANTVFFAPMLCVLFIAAQIRAVQVGTPLQPWAQIAFHVCAWGVLVQTLVTVVLPYLPCGIDARRGTRYMGGDVQFVSINSDSTLMGVLLLLSQYIPMLFVCGGVTAVIVSLMDSSQLAGRRTPVPPSMQCATLLTVQFFAVFLGLRVAVSIRDATHGARGDGGALVRTLHAASATAHFCPMLAVLFIALRMRVQQISGLTAAPQGWAQDAMYLCTGAVLLQLLVCLLIGVATGSAPEMDEHKSFHIESEAKAEGGLLQRAVLGVQAVSLAALYGGAVTVCVALFTVTPATAGAHGAMIPMGL